VLSEIRSFLSARDLFAQEEVFTSTFRWLSLPPKQQQHLIEHEDHAPL
jgi:hypothetical protein